VETRAFGSFAHGLARKGGTVPQRLDDLIGDLLTDFVWASHLVVALNSEDG
jgi:hypothetical protein